MKKASNQELLITCTQLKDHQKVSTSINTEILAVCWSEVFMCVNTMLQSSQEWTSQIIHRAVL